MHWTPLLWENEWKLKCPLMSVSVSCWENGNIFVSECLWMWRMHTCFNLDIRLLVFFFYGFSILYKYRCKPHISSVYKFKKFHLCNSWAALLLFFMLEYSDALLYSSIKPDFLVFVNFIFREWIILLQV